LRRVLEIRPYKIHGVYHVGLNRPYLSRRAAQVGVVNGAPAGHGVIAIVVRDWQNRRAPAHAEMLFIRLGQSASLPLMVFQSMAGHSSSSKRRSLIDRIRIEYGPPSTAAR